MIKIWNKEESINGVSAESYITESPAWMTEGDVILVCNDYSGVVEQILNVNVLRGNLKLDSSFTSLQVGEEYLKSLTVIENTVV